MQSIVPAEDHAHHPPVIEDLFMGLSLDLEKNRWTAKCKSCSLSITDVYRTTSNFLKHMKNRHSARYIDWKNKQTRPSVANNQAKISSLFDRKDDNCEWMSRGEWVSSSIAF